MLFAVCIKMSRGVLTTSSVTAQFRRFSDGCEGVILAHDLGDIGSGSGQF
jgi:hypothetical protein